MAERGPAANQKVRKSGDRATKRKEVVSETETAVPLPNSKRAQVENITDVDDEGDVSSLNTSQANIKVCSYP